MTPIESYIAVPVTKRVMSGAEYSSLRGSYLQVDVGPKGYKVLVYRLVDLYD